MILGKIVGKLSTLEFTFQVEKEAKKFEYLQVYHKTYGYVLCQIIELTKDKDRELAICSILGYKEKTLKPIRTPLDIGAEVLSASDEFIASCLKLENESEGAYIGNLEGRDIKIYLELNKLLTKHVAILAKTGAGKSYVAGVLVEEIMDKDIPLLIIDPHGEYSKMKYPNDDGGFIKPKGYLKHIQEYGDLDISDDFRPLLINDEFSPQELMHIVPAKLTSSQEAIVYSAMKDLTKITLTRIMDKIQLVDGNQKWNLLNVFEYLQKLNIFKENFIPYNELIQPKKCSIINLKGIDPTIQEIIVYKLLKDLFEQRKKKTIPPFFCVLEEAHNFVPERGLGEKKSSGIIRTIASEGRKFGLGLCVISQRPARIEKNVLSQCNTQIILKITNPHDLKAISSSVEGILTDAEEEIKSLPVGNAMVCGVVDVPLFVQIRSRKSKHGGDAVDIFEKEEIDVEKEVEKFQKEILPVINAKFTKKELKLIHGKDAKIHTYLIPAVLFEVGIEKKFSILLDRVKGMIIKDMNQNKTIQLKDAAVLEDYALRDKVEYLKVHYDQKIRPKCSSEDLQKKLEKIIKVNTATSCFVLYHRVENVGKSVKGSPKGEVK